MIRKYEPRDFADCSYLNSVSYISPCPENELWAKLANKSWVSEQDGSVIGCLITCPEYHKNLIWSITVAPGARNKGIGGKLIAEAQKNFSELWLYTEAKGKARKLYERSGFQIVETLEHYYGAWLPTILMRWALPRK